jgi:hypothetical protein
MMPYYLCIWDKTQKCPLLENGMYSGSVTRNDEFEKIAILCKICPSHLLRLKKVGITAFQFR